MDGETTTSNGWNNPGSATHTHRQLPSLSGGRTPYNTNVISNSTYSGGRAQSNRSTKQDPTPPVRSNNTTRTNNSSWNNGYNRGNNSKQ